MALVADNEDAGGGFDDVVGDGVELVDLQHAIDLREESLEEAEVASGDALDRSDCLCISEIVRVEGPPEALPMAVRDEQKLIAPEGSVLV